MNKIFFSVVILVTNLSLANSHSELPAYESICYRQVAISPAQEPSISNPRCRIDKTTLYIDGAITHEITYELKYHPQVNHIELNSYGGLVDAGFEIAELVRNRRITTNVRKGAKCASACTLIYQAGVRRTAYPTVRFLYHGVRLSNTWFEAWHDLKHRKGRDQADDFIFTQMDDVRNTTEKLFAIYIKYGMDPAFIEKYKALADSESWFEEGNFTRTENWIVSVPTMIKYNIVQDFDFRETIE